MATERSVLIIIMDDLTGDEFKRFKSYLINKDDCLSIAKFCKAVEVYARE